MCANQILWVSYARLDMRALDIMCLLFKQLSIENLWLVLRFSGFLCVNPHLNFLALFFMRIPTSVPFVFEWYGTQKTVTLNFDFVKLVWEESKNDTFEPHAKSWVINLMQNVNCNRTITKNVNILLSLEQLKQIFVHAHRVRQRTSERGKNINDSANLWAMLTPRCRVDWKHVSILCLDDVTKQIGHDQRDARTKQNWKKIQLKQ